MFFFFFFQAEDGIRDFHVTGVQTCALPILLLGCRATPHRLRNSISTPMRRSEERRVGKGVDLGGRRIIKKKKKKNNKKNIRPEKIKYLNIKNIEKIIRI